MTNPYEDDRPDPELDPYGYYEWYQNMYGPAEMSFDCFVTLINDYPWRGKKYNGYDRELIMESVMVQLQLLMERGETWHNLCSAPLRK